MPTSLPTATIVICARNAAAHLERCVPAALGQDYAGRFRVMVVDNGSTDDTAAVARRLGARVIRCRRPGVVYAREHGWRACTTDLVAFLDADCEPTADWLAPLARRFVANPQLGAAGARLVPGAVRSLAEHHIAAARILDSDVFWQRNALQWPFLATAATVFRRDALVTVDGFDRSLANNSGEDADLCWRLQRGGWSLDYCREVEVRHHHRATVAGMARQARWYGRGSAALFARWRGELGWWRYTDWGPYRRVLWGVVCAPGAMITGRGYRRWRPALEALDAAAFLIGKWRGALEHRVLFF